jgi:hypothetical protein
MRVWLKDYKIETTLLLKKILKIYYAFCFVLAQLPISQKKGGLLPSICFVNNETTKFKLKFVSREHTTSELCHLYSL